VKRVDLPTFGRPTMPIFKAIIVSEFRPHIVRMGKISMRPAGRSGNAQLSLSPRA
jgi:hypothetical protein